MLMLLLQLWTSSPSTDPRALLSGSWQSCQDDSGEYGERVYDGRWKGIQRFELHMGPRDEFALFVGIQDKHREHDGADNLLAPSYHVNDVDTWRGKRNWNVTALKLWVSVVAAGGSRDVCDSFFVLVKRQ